MVNKILLENMACVSLRTMDPGLLLDILEDELQGESAGQRLERCIAQGGNPYCFRVGNTPVRISFRACEQTLDKKIKSYFLELKNKGSSSAVREEGSLFHG